MSKTNNVRLIGNLGNNPKLITSDNQNMILSVSMATHEHYKDQQGNKQTRTDWHNIVCFGNVANLLHKYAVSGTKLMIEGRLQTRSYNDKDGNTKYVTEIVAEEVLFLDSAKLPQGETK